MIEKIEKNLDTKKATLGHYVWLLQLERELDGASVGRRSEVGR